MSNEKQGAGFTCPMEVMREARRYGKWVLKDNAIFPMWFVNAFVVSPAAISDDDYLKGLEELYAWHLAHPEPRYPTFREWIAPIQRFENKDTDTITWSGSGWYLSLSWVNAHYNTPYVDEHYGLDDIIPEHIAKLLGVEKIVPGRGGND